MKRAIISITIILFFITAHAQNHKKVKDLTIGDVKIFKFYPSDERPLSGAVQLNLPADTKITNVIDSMLVVLNNYDYFSSDTINFKLMKIKKISFPNKVFRLGFVDMIDPQLIALKKHFQGSHGSAVTEMLIEGTLMQPQLKDPLLHGLLITYNGRTMHEMDHINLNRILTPKDCKGAVLHAIRTNWRE